MALADKTRWNEKYQDDKIPQVPLELISTYSKLATGREALDIACGMGRHSKYLAQEGFVVDALDISSVAIDNLQNIANINAKEVDFDSYVLEKDRYDLIVCTYFLQRKLFVQMIDALKPNGLILIETFLHHSDNERVPSNPAFRLNEGELEATFDDRCELLHIVEFWDEDYLGYKTMKTAMVARKKSGGMSDDDFWA
jgi:SAM-dependent methyltransferase